MCRTLWAYCNHNVLHFPSISSSGARCITHGFDGSFKQRKQQPCFINSPYFYASFLQNGTAAKKTTHHGHSHDSSQMNMRGAFLHVLSDALGSVVVIISALVSVPPSLSLVLRTFSPLTRALWYVLQIVKFTDWKYKLYMDPALSVLLVALILNSVWPLLRESALILLQTVPTHIQVDAIQRRLLEKVDGVLAVHEFHVWQLAGDRIIASAHIRCRNLSEYMKIAERVKEFFHNEGIHSTTIQPEFVEIEALNSYSGKGFVRNRGGMQTPYLQWRFAG